MSAKWKGKIPEVAILLFAIGVVVGYGASFGYHPRVAQLLTENSQLRGQIGSLQGQVNSLQNEVNSLQSRFNNLAGNPFGTRLSVVTGSQRLEVRRIDLEAGKPVKILLLTEDIAFSVKDPTGNTIFNAGRVSGERLVPFTPTMSGAHELVFDNSFALFASKSSTAFVKQIP